LDGSYYISYQIGSAQWAMQIRENDPGTNCTDFARFVSNFMVLYALSHDLTPENFAETPIIYAFRVAAL
jgi:hypothetical protein